MTLILSLLTALRAAEAQQPVKVPRIGILINGTAATLGPSIEAFWQGLRTFGYVEGQNIVIEYRWAEGKLDQLPDFATEFVHLKVDLIMAPGGRAVQAAQRATDTIPIVMVNYDEHGSGSRT